MGEEATNAKLNPLAKLAIIGGAGGMGSWFVRYFTLKGFTTTLSDIRFEQACVVAQELGAEIAGTNQDAVKDADMVMICVPIQKTRDTILEVAPYMKHGAVLAEISSVKSPIMDALRGAASMGIQPLSLHPMFGPIAESLEGKTIVVVPVIDRDVEHNITKRLFREAEVAVVGMKEHDKTMAVVLSLTYYMNLAFASVLSETDLISLKRIAGTTFTVQLALAESIAAEDPKLVISLLKENLFTDQYIDSFIAEANALRELIKGGLKSFTNFYEEIRDSLGRDPDYLHANEMRFEAYKVLKTFGSHSHR